MWGFGGSFTSRLNASKNDHVTNLSSDQRAAAGSPRWCLPSVTGGCARGPSRGEPTSRLRLYQARVSSDTGTLDGLAIPTSMLGSCAVADRCALAASLAASRGTVLRSPVEPAVCGQRILAAQRVFDLHHVLLDSQNGLSLALTEQPALPKSPRVRQMRRQRADRFREIYHGGPIRIDR